MQPSQGTREIYRHARIAALLALGTTLTGTPAVHAQQAQQGTTQAETPATHAQQGQDARSGQERVGYLTLDLRMSRAPDSTTMIEAGMNVGKSIRDNLALAIELSGGSAPLLGGNRGAFSILPSAEGYHFFGPVQAYGRLGMGAQYRDGARLDSSKALGMFAAVGGRIRVGRCRGNGPHPCELTGCFVAGLEIRLHHASLNGWLMYPAVLPQGASILSTGFSMGVEL
jgi:hypothetical protein